MQISVNTWHKILSVLNEWDYTVLKSRLQGTLINNT